MKPALILLLALGAARADTVTGKDNRMWNGQVIDLNGAALQLRAYFPSGVQTMKFGRNNLKALEFNTTTNNLGNLPSYPPPTGQPFSGIVVHKDRSSTHCDNLRIDRENVSCSSGSWPRGNVNRILIDQ